MHKKKVRLSDIVARFIDYRGKTPSKTTSGTPLITAKIVKGGTLLPYTEYIEEDAYEAWMTKGIPNAGDVIMTMEAPLGEVAAMPPGKVALAQRVIVMQTNPDECHPGYLKYHLQWEGGRQAIFNKRSGSTVFGIRASELKKVVLHVHDSTMTQERIAKSLSSLDAKIEHNLELIRMLEQQAQLMYDYWFMQFDFPDGNGKPYRSSGGKMVWSEELKREIPEGWSVKPCGEVFGVTRGKSYSSEEIEKGSTLMINLKNLAPYGGYNRNMEKPYSGTFTANHVAKEGDVLMGVTDMTRERRMVGYVLRVPLMEQECIFSMDLIKLLPIAVSSTFLYTSLYYGKYGKRFSQFAQGTNVLHLNPTAISRIPFVVPKKQVLELADSIFEGIYEKIDALEAENSLLAAQRDFLLPRLMTGEITVAE